MNCKTFQDELPNLLLEPTLANPAVVAHIDACPPCKREYAELQQTFGMLDQWTAPEPSPYFDQKLAVRVREAQAEPAMSWFEQLQNRLLFNTGRQFRPAMAGAMAFVLALGGGTSIAIRNYVQPAAVVEASDTVKDLQILDRNDQAFQQMDQLLQDEDAGSSDDTPSTAPPIS